MVNFNQRVVWLTGASSGIGYCLAEKLIEQGAKLIVTARSEEKLLALKKINPTNVTVLACDLSDANAISYLTQRLNAITRNLDTVILNAGNCEYVDIDKFDVDLIRRVNAVNYDGFVQCVAAALPLLKASTNNPHLVGVSSAAAFIGLPRSEAYGGSKAAMRHFLQCLRLDLAPYKITTSIVYPGFVDTPLTRKNDFPMPFLMTTNEAVEKILAGLRKQSLEIAFPRRLIWPLKLLSILPAGLSARLCANMVRKDNVQ